MARVPVVIEGSGPDERVVDIYSRLLRDRIVFLATAVDESLAHSIVAQLIYLSQQDPTKDIFMYINSPGGSVTAGLAIYDVMQAVPCDVATVCMGQCASMGSLLLAAGAKGKRYSLPHGRIMIHQPLAGMEGTATDIMIHAEEFIRLKKTLYEIYRKHSGQDIKKLDEDMDRDRFLSASEATEYKLIDKVIEKLPPFEK